MNRDLAALGYLEYRQIVNWLRSTVRSPGRAVLYLFVVAYFILMGALRTRGHVGTPQHHVPDPYASALMFAFVTLVGIVAYGAASGIAGTFSSAADARFLIGSRLPERTVVVWLQLRRSAASILRMLFTVILYTLMFSRSGTFGGIGFAMIGGAILTTATAIPMMKLRAVAGARTAQSLALAVAVVGTLTLVILLGSTVAPTMAAPAQIVERTGAGLAFNALFDGNATALALLYAAALIMVGLSFALGTGLYPDLYASSLRVLAFRERQRRGAGAAFTIEHTYESGGARRLRHLFDSLGGPWTIAWKEWIAFVRSPSMQRTFLLGVFVCGILGAVFGVLVARSNDPMVTAASLATSATSLIVIFIAMGSALSLGEDLRKPLWWMGPDPLWMRLLAWIAGTSWRLAACLSIGMIAWSIAMRLPAVVLAGVPLAFATVLYLRAVGLVLYALFPSSIDQRGPLAMIRALMTYLLAAPPIVAGSVIGGLLHTIEGGLAVGILASVAEAMGLIAFASARISGRGAAFAQAEAL